MITLQHFYLALKAFRPDPDEAQKQAIEAPPDSALYIVAGPGSGKTTCLTLRVLKLIFVDGVPPTGIVATTFTVKAAEELRSRLLGWGFKLTDALDALPNLSKEDRRSIRAVDINQVWTGTLDSLSEQLLRDHRLPGEQPPILADEFVSKTLLLREGLLQNGRHSDLELDAWLRHFHGPSDFGFHIGAKSKLLQSAWDRRHHDLIDWDTYVSSPSSEPRGEKAVVDEAMQAYRDALAQRFMLDFTLLEYELLRRLTANSLSEFTSNLKVLLVDEYQDSNLLQEQIYFHLAKSCDGALSVVGDDDQSLYRFRGATVELFRDFHKRYHKFFKTYPTTVYLNTNYRSTKKIVDFVNTFVKLDSPYQQIRVAGKPDIIAAHSAMPGLPILGIFRESPEQLATAVADFIYDVFRGDGIEIPGLGVISRDPASGDLGDCALLSSSPAEYNAGGKERFPLLLSRALGSLRDPILTFNPRGESLSRTRIVALFGGLLAECLDPGGGVQDSGPFILRETRETLDLWRVIARSYLSSSDCDPGLRKYVEAWQQRKSDSSSHRWPKRIPVIELIYALAHYQPEMHNDPEGQIYLEVFTRQLNACEQISGFKGIAVFDPSNPGLSQKSLRDLLRDFLAPIAAEMIDIDEELIGSFPRDRLSVLSIHQSKGLEFPLAIVDIGSEFKTNHHAQAFKRFPVSGGDPHRMEDALRPHSQLASEKRSMTDRAFDDLIRQYFVAFSRAQNVLLLVGLNSAAPDGQVKNIAAGWCRHGRQHWGRSDAPIWRL